MRKILFLILLLPIFFSSRAEDIPQDAGLWTSINVDKKLTRSFEVSISEELRFANNISEIDQFFTNVGVSYKLSKKIKVGLFYRFISKNEDYDYYSENHRLYFDASYKESIKEFDFVYRFRYQSQLREINKTEDSKLPDSYMRHKLSIRHDINKFTPYVGTEWFYQFSDPGFHEGDNLWVRYRLYAGSDYKFNRRTSVGLYYMYQYDFNVKNPERDYVIGLEYNLSF